VVLSFVKVETDEGIGGVGLGGGGKVGDAIIQRLKPEVIGEDPLNVERIWHKMWQPKLVGRRGLSTRAISAIDIALWDTIGKFLNQPVYKLLGGFADKVPTYIAGGYYEEGKGLKELAEEMEQNLRLGAKCIKMKIGGASISEDVERVRVVRETIGPTIGLMVDANNAYRYYEAIQIAKQIEKYDIFWFEEPVMPDDYIGHAKIAAATYIPIAHWRERVYPLRLPRPHRARVGRHLQRRCQYPWRSH
jgi:L-alanine-DL-glutamate epimerase-like enolase superfamily enzyme